MVKGKYRHLPLRQLDHLARPRQLVGALAVDLERRIGWRRLHDRPREARQYGGNRRRAGPHIGRRGHRPFGIVGRRRGPPRHGELIPLGRIEHPACQLRRLAQGNRQHARRQRIERAAMADLDLGVARLPQDALDRRDAARAAEPARFVEDDPAVRYDHDAAARRIRSSRPAAENTLTPAPARPKPPAARRAAPR